MKNINILTFNYGYGSFTNGPGISCWNFTKFCKKKFNIFTKLDSYIYSDNILSFKKYNYNSDIFHWWSGDVPEFLDIAIKESKLGKKIIIGPNLLDGTNPEREIQICNMVKPSVILTVNKEIKYKINKYINFPIEEFMTGPDYDLWTPKKDINDKILWKGNSRDLSKDISMALHLKKKFVDNMDIYGYSNIYSYPDTVIPHSKYYMYVSTSLSETKSEAVLEQMAAGVPCITNRNVFISGINYKTGIISDRNLNEYSKNIKFLLNNKNLRKEMSISARQFILENFNKNYLDSYYNWIINEY
jgi:glycosyltransferase involved in cell wall biosynthesis